jgi:hypothetical protein
MALPAIGALMSSTKLIGAIAGVAILATAGFALYSVAYSKGENVSKVAIQGYQTKVQQLNAKLLEEEQKVTERVIREYHTKTIERERTVYRNGDTITRVVPEQYLLSKGWVYAHDQTAKDESVDPSKASNVDASTVSDRAALNVVAENNALANQNADQLEALQTWITDVNKTRDSVTAKP